MPSPSSPSCILASPSSWAIDCRPFRCRASFHLWIMLGESPQGAGMQVSYNLEKRDGAWVVLKTQAAGGMIQHPDPNQNPHQNQDVHSGGLPRFNDVLNPVAAPAQGSPPPGHPPAKSQPPASQLGGQDQASAKKPR